MSEQRRKILPAIWLQSVSSNDENRPPKGFGGLILRSSVNYFCFK